MLKNLFLENNIPVVLDSSDSLAPFLRELNKVTDVSYRKPK
jgi:hypothetical protein